MSVISLLKEERAAVLSRAVKAWADVDRYLAIVLVAAIVISVSAWRFVLEKQGSARRAQAAIQALVLEEPTDAPPPVGSVGERNQFIGSLRGTALDPVIEETLGVLRDLNVRAVRLGDFGLTDLRDDEFSANETYAPHNLEKFLDFLEADGMRGDAGAVATARPAVLQTGLGPLPAARLELLLDPQLAATLLEERVRIRIIYAALPEATPYALDGRPLADIEPSLRDEVDAIASGSREDVELQAFPAPLPLREALIYFPAALALAAVIVSSLLRGARAEGRRYAALTERFRAAGEAAGDDMDWLSPAPLGLGVARIVTLLLAIGFSGLAFYFTPMVIGSDLRPAWIALVVLAVASLGLALVASFPLEASLRRGDESARAIDDRQAGA